MTSRLTLAVSFVLAVSLCPLEVSAESKKRRSKLSKAEKSQILALFTATKKRFKKDGTLSLIYNFESKDDDLVVTPAKIAGFQIRCHCRVFHEDGSIDQGFLLPVICLALARHRFSRGWHLDLEAVALKVPPD